jgi:hypothetical protein
MAKAKKKGGKIPKTYGLFLERYPEIGQAWELLRKAEGKGGLSEKSMRLIKLGIAIGGMKEGAVHSGVRKAPGAGALSRGDRASRGHGGEHARLAVDGRDLLVGARADRKREIARSGSRARELRGPFFAGLTISSAPSEGQ